MGRILAPAVVAASTLSGWCCCCCGSGAPAPVPVPPEYEAHVGRWVCGGGDVHELRADGTYLRRRGDHLEPVRPILNYTPSGWTVDRSVHLLGIRLASETTVAIGATFDAEHGQVCATIDARACARMEHAPPASAVGRWTGQGVQVDIRSDGYVRVVEAGRPMRDGALWVVAASASVQLCGPPLAGPLGWMADGTPTWNGLALELVERDWDEKALAAETARREARSRDGRDFDLDLDLDLDFD